MSSQQSRGFNQSEALDRALALFWRNGYEGTSIADLTEAIGISRPSLYAAFGDKEQLFRAVLAHYGTGPGAYIQHALDKPRAADAIRALLLNAAASFTSLDPPPGCLVVQGALATGREGVTARDLLVAERLSRQATVHARLKRDVSEGDLPAGTDPVAITEYIMTLLNGMAVQVLGGADGPMLIAVAETGLRALGLEAPVRAAPDVPKKASAPSPGKRTKVEKSLGQLAMDLWPTEGD
ncbi:TetR/AcrR family transcriptional regulator [Sphingomonas sp. H160509]|uniref:TetR/AcrR family transcriptional regulator n=1 Tax=Sphingomonas sp. H160509 TaxID=2955313 RepID=UPI002097D89C|nr:TetR/AcrR family transcriptional regulator [Sphingomonas sp. H160509]MDD1453238.1 TetR/AcrR family transcriptional regulator [Sphingomonas sp. H160509]